ncbi:MAG: hypothetical protein AAFN10_13630 [Bacteroidota bacterium]
MNLFQSFRRKNECQKTCRAEFGWNKEIKRACTTACNSPSGPVDAREWWDSLPAMVQTEYQGGTEAAVFEELIQEPTANYKPIIMGLGIMICLLGLYMIFR